MGQRDLRLLDELLKHRMNVASEQDTHFNCAAVCRVQKDDYIVFLAYSSRSSVGAFLLIGRSLNADVNLVLANDRGQLLFADDAVKHFEFCSEGFLFSAISAVPRRSKTDSDNGWSECDPWSLDRQGRKGT